MAPANLWENLGRYIIITMEVLLLAVGLNVQKKNLLSWMGQGSHNYRRYQE